MQVWFKSQFWIRSGYPGSYPAKFLVSPRKKTYEKTDEVFFKEWTSLSLFKWVKNTKNLSLTRRGKKKGGREKKKDITLHQSRLFCWNFKNPSLPVLPPGILLRWAIFWYRSRIPGLVLDLFSLARYQTAIWCYFVVSVQYSFSIVRNTNKATSKNNR